MSSPTFGERLRNFANISTKSIIDISFSSDTGDRRTPRTVTTGDTIEGSACIATPNDVHFDGLEVAFVGYAKTYIDRVGTTASSINHRTEASHTFLRLIQPLDESLLPQSRTFKAGESCSIPFTFRVPSQLLPTSCRHVCSSARLKDAHLQLPPSLGDPELAAMEHEAVDDMSPDMSRISYGVRVRIFAHGKGKDDITHEKSRKIRLMPAVEELPPVDVDGEDDEYKLRAEKSIRKNMFKHKTGRLVMEASQPKSLRLRPYLGPSADPPSTVARVRLRFDCVNANAQPPRLDKLSGRLRVATYIGCTPRQEYPTKFKAAYDPNLQLYPETLYLPSRNVAGQTWQRIEAGTAESEVQLRRSSTVSMSAVEDFPTPSAKYSEDKPYWVTDLLYPVALPTTHHFVPTFHSCIVSRVYIIELTLSYLPSSGSTSLGNHITLKLPVQVSVGTEEASSPVLRDEEEVTFAEGNTIDEYLTPRNTMAPPFVQHDPAMIGRRQTEPSAPPDYSLFAPRTVPVF